MGLQTKYFSILGFHKPFIRTRLAFMAMAAMDLINSLLNLCTLGTITIRSHDYFGLMTWIENLIHQTHAAQPLDFCNCLACQQTKRDGIPRPTKKEVEDKLDEFSAVGAPIEEAIAWLKSKGISVDVIPIPANDDKEGTFH